MTDAVSETEQQRAKWRERAWRWREKHPEQARVVQKRYYQKTGVARARAWREKNPDKVRSIRKKHYEKNRAAIRARHKAWYEKNRARVCQGMRPWRKAYSRLWRETNPKYDAVWRENNREKIRLTSKKHYRKDLARSREKRAAWYERNGEKVRERRKVALAKSIASLSDSYLKRLGWRGAPECVLGAVRVHILLLRELRKHGKVQHRKHS